ncbi:MAG: hypothetical protein HYU67_02280 [Flavobacteriia bacterium]|nr:hypothetical protein [Flavobacteriia bacterium]
MASYKFRVLLDNENNEEIFRDILIHDQDNFESFYHEILDAFSFNGDQMASFYLSNENWDKGHEICLMDINYGDELIEEKSSVMSQTNINKMIENENQKIILVHDFMRMWIFLIELIEKIEEKISKPKVLLSVGIAPPEDSKSIDFVLDNENSSFDDEDEFSEEWDDEFGSEFEEGYDEEDYNKFNEEY